MTDPYEYLFKKLRVKLQFYPKFNYFVLNLDNTACISETDNLVPAKVPANKTKRIFRFYKNLDPLNGSRRENQKLDRFCRQLSCFPDKLESIEHVDLLLAVNGLNKA